MNSRCASTASNPFPGLRPFDESEQHLFFGRESQVDAMVDKLATHRFLAVTGTSGSGKSSLVNCGLRPALRTGLLAAAGSSWRMTQCRPGGDPVVSLAAALAEDGVLFADHIESGMPLHEIIETTLRMGRLGLVDMVEQAQLAKSTNVLLVIDQFEELFRYRHLGGLDDDESSDSSRQDTAFVNLLLSAIEQPGVPIYVVITIRSDFIGECARFNGLAEAINDGQYLVPRMTREQRREAITGPIGVGGAKIYPALLTRLVNDVGSDPDQLSILQHALNRTWSCWDEEHVRQGMLDIECYESIGSMDSALDRHADKAYGELVNERERTICQHMFRALTDKASDARGVRRPTRLSTLCEICEATRQEMISVIDAFRKPSRSFLMPPEGVELQPDTVVDISHESLMRGWRRLDRWADEEADAARMYRRLAETSALYREDHAGLLRDPDLRVALEWKERNRPNATWAGQYRSDFDSAMSFLAQSRKSDVVRKRLFGGSILAVLFVTSGYLAYSILDLSARNTELADKKEEVQIELEDAEQAKIEALNEVEQVRSDVRHQVEGNARRAVADIEADLSRIMTEGIEQTRQAAVQDRSHAAAASAVARQQMAFFDAIGELDETRRQRLVRHFANLDGELDDMHVRYSEALANVRMLNVQIDIRCELLLANDSVAGPPDSSIDTLCVTSISEELQPTETPDSRTFPEDACEPSAVPATTLETLGSAARQYIEGRDRRLGCEIVAMKDKTRRLDEFIETRRSALRRLRERAGHGSIEVVTDTVSNADATARSAIDGARSSRGGVDRESLRRNDPPGGERDTDALGNGVHVTVVGTPGASAVSRTSDLESSSPVVDSSGTYLKQFLACEKIERLEPANCRGEDESFSPGRVYAYARVVTVLPGEEITLRWFRDRDPEPFDERIFAVQPNSEGYRTYTWKSLDKGTYRACLHSRSGAELQCIGITVDGPDRTTGTAVRRRADDETTIATRPRSQTTQATESRRPASTDPRTDPPRAWPQGEYPVAARLEDSRGDGFAVCADVVKLQPMACGDELDPGRVYAFARIVTPHEEETITLHWFRDDVEIGELRKELAVKRNTGGYRTYAWNTFDTGSYAVSLSDRKGEELGRIAFTVR